jgi:phage terminase small subunit
MTKLTLKQKLFCEAYIETLGNATEAVIRAGYDVKSKNGHLNRTTAKSIASENLTKPYICDYIKSLLDKSGLNNQNVGIQLNFLINQLTDLSVKARAIEIYYKTTGAYAPEKLEIKNQPLFSEDQMYRIAKEIVQRQSEEK